MRARPALLLAVACVVTACVDERERLSAPRIVMELDTREVSPGSVVSGRVIAMDSVSGIVAIAARASVGDSAYRDRADFFPIDSIDLPFSLRVPADAPEGSWVVVLGSTINDQLLGNSVSDSARVRVLP
jgi:hypothetical protein